MQKAFLKCSRLLLKLAVAFKMSQALYVLNAAVPLICSTTKVLKIETDNALNKHCTIKDDLGREFYRARCF